jgi:beta-lactam-binding protein with PASTA domain
VIGVDHASAAVALEEAGFYVDVRFEPSTQPPGTVIYQSPSAGTEATQTSTVTITVAEEPGQQTASESAVPAGPG